MLASIATQRPGKAVKTVKLCAQVNYACKDDSRSLHRFYPRRIKLVWLRCVLPVQYLKVITPHFAVLPNAQVPKRMSTLLHYLHLMK